MITKAYNRIKEGIIWVKNNPKKALLALLGIGFVSAAPLLFPGTTEENKNVVADLVFNGKTISFPYTDDNTGETLIIKTDQQTYSSWDSAYVHFAVKNITNNDQSVKVQFAYDGGASTSKIEEFKPQVAYQVEVPTYAQRTYECKTGWEQQSADPLYSQNYICKGDQKTARFCDSVDKTICTVDNEQTGTTLETRYKDEWGTINKDVIENLKSKDVKPIDVKFVPKEQITYWIPAGATKYFRAKIVFNPKSNGEFYINAYGHLNAVGHLDPFYDSAWGYRRQITLDYTKVATTTALTGFPLMFSTSTIADLKFTGSGGKVGKSDGTDILITESDGTTKLPHEIEKYSSSTGETILWFKSSTSTPLSTSTNTTYYLYYGNSGASDQQDVTNVWDSNYVSVWHLGDSDSYSLNDSKNVNNATQSGTINNGTGKMGYGIDIGGGSNFASSTTTSFPSGSNAVTMSYWLKLDSGSDWAGILGYGTSAYVRAFSAYNYYSIDLHQLWGGGGTAKDISATVPTTLKYYSLHITGSATYAAYENGTLYGSGNYASGDAWNILPATMYMGISPVGYGSMDGVLDEVRISNVSRSASWILTEYNNQSSPNTFWSVGAEENLGLTGYCYRRTITIDNTKVASSTSESYTDFPLLASTSLSTLATVANGGKVNSDSGYDIVFSTSTDTSANKLPHEIEGYASSTGAIQAWVKVPSISTSSPTTLYMYYGQSGAGNQQDIANVWNSNYKGVWHLNETPTASMEDSTTNNNVGTPQNLESEDQSTGQIDGSLVLDGTNEYVSVADSASMDMASSFSLCSWFNPSALPGSSAFDGIFSKGGTGETAGNNHNWFLWLDNGVLAANQGVTFGFESSNGTNYQTKEVVTLTTGTWYHYCGVFDDAADTVTLYKNGEQISQATSQTGTPENNAQTVTLGGARAAGDNNLTGTLDNTWITNSVISADWIKTEYNNQSSPSTFYTIGDEVNLCVTGDAPGTIYLKGDLRTTGDIRIK